MSRILVTSCKGGVGKSTVSAGLAIALSRMGKKVLLIDFDLGNRSLDLMLGMEDDLIYDICDLTGGRVDCESVVHLVPGYPNLAFIGAPFRYEGGMTEEALSDALHRLEEVYGFDFILVDTSGARIGRAGGAGLGHRHHRLLAEPDLHPRGGKIGASARRGGDHGSVSHHQRI